MRDAIAKAIQLKQSAIDVERRSTRANQRIAEITAEQNRIRENMKTVAQSTQYYDRLLTKLNEQETSIERLQKERDALIVRRDGLRKRARGLPSGLERRDDADAGLRRRVGRVALTSH